MGPCHICLVLRPLLSRSLSTGSALRPQDHVVTFHEGIWHELCFGPFVSGEETGVENGRRFAWARDGEEETSPAQLQGADHLPAARTGPCRERARPQREGADGGTGGAGRARDTTRA